jgi:RNA polymerase sigma factor (sigma-70 family)
MDEHELRRFAEEDYPRIVSALALYCGSRQIAEDSVQDALVKAMERSRDDLRSVPLWVTTVAFNRAKRAFRRRAAEDLQPWPDQPAVDDREHVSRALDVRAAVAALPRRQRQVVILHHLLGHPVDEIATALSISSGAVKNALHKGRANLAAALGSDYQQGAIDVHRR